mmetsp:Transcript_82008/g.232203  ORF Transcript_82008/g.232203 Transcript_82008/m.232203 type:complete len:232 (+) Transcript_82008:474-1169(+)
MLRVLGQGVAEVGVDSAQVKLGPILVVHVTRKLVTVQQCSPHCQAIPQKVRVHGLLPEVARLPGDAVVGDPVQIRPDGAPQGAGQAPVLAGELHQRHRAQPRAVRLRPAPAAAVGPARGDVPLGLQEDGVARAAADPGRVGLHRLADVRGRDKVPAARGREAGARQLLQRRHADGAVPRPVIGVTPLADSAAGGEGGALSRRGNDGARATDVQVRLEVASHQCHRSLVERQ